MKKQLFIIGLFFSLIFQLSSQITWHLSDGGMPADYVPTAFALASNNDVYLACEQQTTFKKFIRMMKSTNNGANWSEVQLTTTLEGDVYDVVFSGNYMLMSTGRYDTILRSSNNGVTWQLSTLGMDQYMAEGYFAVRNNGDVYLAVTYIDTLIVPMLYRSSNNGSTWTQIQMNNHIDWTTLSFNNYAGSLAFSGDTLLMRVAGKLYRSPNFGIDWESMSDGPPFGGNKIVKHGANSLVTFINQGSTVVMYESDDPLDKGNFWNILPSSSTPDLLNARTLIRTSDRLLIGGGVNSTNSAIYASLQPVGIDEPCATPNTKLYPVPAKDHLYIESAKCDPHIGSFSGTFDISIYSVSGQLVKRCFVSELEVDISDLSPAVYHVRCSDGQNVYQGRFVKGE